MVNTPPPSSSTSFSKKIRQLSVAAVCAGAAASQADAALISHDYTGFGGTGILRLSFDPFTGSTFPTNQFTVPTNAVSLFACGSSGPYSWGTVSAWAVTTAGTPFTFDALAEGETVDSGDFFNTANSQRLLTTDLVRDGVTENYVGFKFISDASTYYGYAEIVVGNNYTAITRSVINDVAGQSIAAGAGSVPEPGSAAALAGVTALGFVALKRRRRD
jgi:hypothetical protein